MPMALQKGLHGANGSDDVVSFPTLLLSPDINFELLSYHILLYDIHIFSRDADIISKMLHAETENRVIIYDPCSLKSVSKLPQR
jgi:hypothetical protein